MTIPKLESEFWKFHGANPAMYETLCMLARRWLARHPGRKCGVAMLYETARWAIVMRVTTTDDFKCNNNHKAYYARLMMRQEPEFADLFDIRELAKNR